MSNLLEETNASGVAQADYIYLDGRPIAVLNGSTFYFLHDDMLGTPQLATDINQAVQWQASYDSFGQASVSGTITQNLRFPGQYFDVETGWNHNGFRDYAPTLGRYAEPDPLGRLGSGNNLYVYVGDNPINLTDRLGLCPSRLCVTGALEEVLASGETPKEPNNGYGTNVGGKVSKAPLFPQYVGQSNVQLSMNQIATLTGNPQLYVSYPQGLSSAFSRYQITNSTAKYFECSDFSPSGQDDCAAAMLNFYDAVQPAMQGDLQQAFWNMWPWASMPNSPLPGRKISMDQALQTFKDALSYLPECQ
jgi:RHS repeat-associated protein